MARKTESFRACLRSLCSCAWQAYRHSLYRVHCHLRLGAPAAWLHTAKHGLSLFQLHHKPPATAVAMQRGWTVKHVDRGWLQHCCCACMAADQSPSCHTPPVSAKAGPHQQMNGCGPASLVDAACATGALSPHRLDRGLASGGGADDLQKSCAANTQGVVSAAARLSLRLGCAHAHKVQLESLAGTAGQLNNMCVP